MIVSDKLAKAMVSSGEAPLPEMSKAKRDLLFKYLAGTADQRRTSQAIDRRDRASEPQLSFGQERLWFVEQLMPGSAIFNVPIAVRIQAPIDHNVLQRCINEIVRRHETLRTTFAIVDGKPQAVIAQDQQITIATTDLRGLSQAEQETSVRQLTDYETLRPFDLTVGPLIRVGLIKLNENDQVLLVTMHHIISDGWSMVVFFRELTQLYRAFTQRQQSPLPELQIQYADYAAWQKDRLQGPVLEQQLSYWKENLSGDLPVLDLATDRPRPTISTNSGARESLLLSEPLTRAITALSQRAGATLFMTLLAAFKILLSRHSGLEDIIVGTPIASRPQSETEGLIGFFINNLTLRTDLSGNPSFDEVLARVRETALEAYAHQDLPFEKIVEELNPARSLSRTPIFQVFFNLLNFAEKIQLPGDDREVPYIEAWAQSDKPYSQFDMTLYAAEQRDALKLVLLYNTDIFDKERMVSLLEQFVYLLAQIVERPDEAISKFSLATEYSRFVLPDPIRRTLPACSQIKIEEIEAVISKHPSIKQTKAVLINNESREKRLVAYVVPSEEIETIVYDLRRWVKQRLPHHMIPSEFVVLDELPRSVDGNLDLSALPSPEGRQFLQNSFIAPRNTLEMLLVKTWETVLDVRPIGVTDNFFDLGGQSLLAIHLFARIEKVFGKKLPLTALFQAPTVEQLAGLLSEEKWSPTWSSLVPIQPGGSKPPLFCLHLALGHVLFYRDLANRLGSDQPVYAFRPQGLDGIQPRHRRVEEMASHYIKEMRALQPDGPYYLCGSSFGGLIAFEMAQQLVAQGQEVRLLGLFDTLNPRLLLAPKVQSWTQTIRRVSQRVELHVGNLLLLNHEGRVKYVRDKATSVHARIKGNIRRLSATGVKKIGYKWNGHGHSVASKYEKEADDLREIRTYLPEMYPGRVTLFRACKQPAGFDFGSDLGWSPFAAGGIDVHEIPGYHGSIVTEPRVRILAEQLQACLSRAAMYQS